MVTGSLSETPTIFRWSTSIQITQGLGFCTNPRFYMGATLLFPAVRRVQMQTTMACRMCGKQRVV